jgi:hypothetical protein
MNKEKLKYEDFISSFDEYEKRFSTNVNDMFLREFFDNFENKIQKSNLSPEQLMEIKNKLGKLLQIFANKKQLLQNESIDILERQDQLNRYITNSNFKK